MKSMNPLKRFKVIFSGLRHRQNQPTIFAWPLRSSDPMNGRSFAELLSCYGSTSRSWPVSLCTLYSTCHQKAWAFYVAKKLSQWSGVGHSNLKELDKDSFPNGESQDVNQPLLPLSTPFRRRSGLCTGQELQLQSQAAAEELDFYWGLLRQKIGENSQCNALEVCTSWGLAFLFVFWGRVFTRLFQFMHLKHGPKPNNA